MVSRDLNLRLAVWAATLLGAATLHSQNPQPVGSTAQQFEEAVTLVDSRGDCTAAVPAFERVTSSADRALAARALVYLGACYERLGNEKARQAYRRVIEHYPDQRAAATQARDRLAALDRLMKPPVGPTLRPLWARSAHDGLAGRPTLDGRTVPLGGENDTVVLSDLDLGRRRQPIPLGAASDGLPSCTVRDPVDVVVVLSPDGRQAAFTCEVTKGRNELRVIRTDVSPARQRLVLAASVEPLEWRNANALLVQRRTGPQADLAFVNTETSAIQLVTTLTAPVTNASVSPDGAWVAFHSPDAAVAGRHDIMVARSKGGTPIAVTTGPSDNQLPGWTPNGRGVLFVSDRTGSPGLWVQPLADGRPAGPPQLLTQDLGRVMDVLAATSGGEFVYFRQTGLVKVAVAGVRADGSVTEPSMTDTRQFGGTMMPGWSPDGARLVYQATLTGTRSLVLGFKDLRTGEERMVTTPLSFVLPRFSPDGRSVAVTGRDPEGHYGLFLIDTVSGQASALKLMPRMEEDTLGGYHWAADGSLIVMVGHTCQRIDVQSRQSTTLWTRDGFVGRFAVQQKTGAIAYVHHLKGVITLEVREPDGSSLELLRAAPDENFFDVDWTPDGDAVVFTRIALGRAVFGAARWPALWRIDVKTLTAHPMGLSLDGLRDVVMSPDGTKVAFTTGNPTREPWILEHYLPASYTRPVRR